MRRICGVLVLAAVLMPASASAASWHHFSSKSFGFSLRYPSGWTLTKTDVPRQVTIVHGGKQTYSFQVVVLSIRPGKTIGATLSAVKSFERVQGNTAFVQAHWTGTSLGGRPAMVAVIRPSTEGGVTISDGLYVAASRTHVFEITLTAQGALTISRFPSVYAEILRTWRYL